jgi:hypothetical protein
MMTENMGHALALKIKVRRVFSYTPTVTVACKSRKSFFKHYQYIALKYEPRVAKYGCSLTKDIGVSEEVLQGGKVSSAVGACVVLGQILTLSCSALADAVVAIILGNPGGLKSGVCE